MSRKLKAGLLLGHNRPHNVIGKKNIKFVGDIGHEIGHTLLAGGPFGILPELNYKRIFIMREFKIAEVFIRHDSGNIKQGVARLGVVHHQKEAF